MSLLRTAEQLLREVEPPDYRRKPLGCLIHALRADTEHSRTALSAFVDHDGLTIRTRRQMSYDLPPGTDDLAESRDAVASQLRIDLMCLLRAVTASRYESRIGIGTPHLASSWNLPPSHPARHLSLRKALWRTREHLYECCTRVSSLLGWLGSLTLSALPTMSSPYGALRHLLVVEYRFGDSLQHSADAWSETVPVWLPRLESECALVEASFLKWRWSDSQHVALCCKGWATLATSLPLAQSDATQVGMRHLIEAWGAPIANRERHPSWSPSRSMELERGQASPRRRSRSLESTLRGSRATMRISNLNGSRRRAARRNLTLHSLRSERQTMGWNGRIGRREC
jgi:hypothetical protein